MSSNNLVTNSGVAHQGVAEYKMSSAKRSHKRATKSAFDKK